MNSQSATPLPRQPLTNWGIWGPMAVWLVALPASWWWMNQYEFGTNAASPHRVVSCWPEGSKLSRSGERPTLLLFLHPRCSCSRASLAELERLFTSVRGAASTDPDLIVVATVPTGAESAWLQTDTVARARKLASARLFVDRGGVEAARFGATTSGLVMLFSQDGIRQYAGGITICRAHEGGNVGRDSLAQLLHGQRGTVTEIPAFGCQLCLPEPARETAANATRSAPATMSAI